MKDMMKTVLAILLTLSLSVSAFAAGAADGTADGAGAAAAGPVTIELWYGAAVTEAGPPPDDWAVLRLIRDRLNIDLRISALPSSVPDQDVKINAAGAANALPDLFMVGRTPWTNLVNQGLIAPVDELYPLMPNRTRIQYDADSVAFTTVRGQSFGLASPGAVPRNEGLVIRKDWLDRLGLRVPTTTEELFAVMRAFTFNDPDGNGRADTFGYGAFPEINPHEGGLGRRLDPLFGAFGVAGTWDLSRTTPGLNVRKPEYFDAVAYVKRMVDEKIIDPNWTTYRRDDFRAAWKQGRFGVMREQHAALAAEHNYAPFDRNFPTGEWIVMDPPRGPAGRRSVGIATQSYRVYAVSTRAMRAGKGPAIARLLEWMSSDEGYYLLGWGVEGVNYMKGPGGVPVLAGLPDETKGFSRPGMAPITQLRNMVFYNSEIELTARFPTYRAPTSGRTMSALTVLRDMQRREWTNGLGVETLPAAGADLWRFYSQGVMEFVLGTRPLTRANWTAWVAEFDRIGGLEWERAGIAFARENNLLR